MREAHTLDAYKKDVENGVYDFEAFAHETYRAMAKGAARHLKRLGASGKQQRAASSSERQVQQERVHTQRGACAEHCAAARQWPRDSPEHARVEQGSGATVCVWAVVAYSRRLFVLTYGTAAATVCSRRL